MNINVCNQDFTAWRQLNNIGMNRESRKGKSEKKWMITLEGSGHLIWKMAKKLTSNTS